jgi:hypothetical protein
MKIRNIVRITYYTCKSGGGGMFELISSMHINMHRQCVIASREGMAVVERSHPLKSSP